MLFPEQIKNTHITLTSLKILNVIFTIIAIYHRSTTFEPMNGELARDPGIMIEKTKSELG